MKRSTREERRIAERLGGRRLPRSGGLPWSRYDTSDVIHAQTAQGDITTPEWHIEHKRVEPQSKSIRIPREWLVKVTEGARMRMRTPALVVSFETSQGHAQDWVFLPLEEAERLLAQARRDA